MIKVVKITSEQADSLRGKKMDGLAFFNPFEINGIWYISIHESKIVDFECEIVEIYINFGENKQDD